MSIRCARGQSLEAGGLSSSVDWETAVEYAQVHGTVQFLAAAIARGGAQIPEGVSAILSRQQQRNAARAMLQHRACDSALNAFDAAGIRAVPFKGTTLAKLLYGRVSDRNSCDVDLLVARHDLARARDVLLQAGYQLADGVSRLDLDLLLERGNEMAFIDANGTLIELHWRLFESNRAAAFPIDLEGLQLDGRRIANSDHFLILVLHGLSHHWEAMKWVIDIDAFVRRVPVGWSTVIDRARDTGALRALHIALLLSNLLFETPLPFPIDDRASLKLAKRYARGIVADAAIPPILDLPMQLRARERWRDRLAFLRFVAQSKPWDDGYATRFVRLVAHSFRRRRIAAAQIVPELRRH